MPMNSIKTLDPREELEAEDSYNPDDGDCGYCHGACEGCSACRSRMQYMRERLKFREEMYDDC